MQNLKKTVILDTDLGGDIDDSWALAQLLGTPSLDLKLIAVATGDVKYRAAMVRRLLLAAGRKDIPVALGRRSDTKGTFDDLEWPPAAEYPDAVTEMVNIIRKSETPVTIIEIAPFSNLGDLLAAAPDVAAKVDLIAMGGSIDRGLDAGSPPICEYNIRCDIPASQTVFAAPWHSFTLVPLDSCADVRLAGNWVNILAGAPTELAREVGRQYHAWLRHWDYNDETGAIPGQTPLCQSSALFDTVAVHLAASEKYLRLEPMTLAVDDAGFCRRTAGARTVRVAIGWKDLAGYTEQFSKLLLSEELVPQSKCLTS